MTIADYLEAKGVEKGLKKGREEGREEGQQLIIEALDLIQKGLELDVVAKEMNLSSERVRQLAAIIKAR